MTQYGNALEWASAELRVDQEVVLAAMRNREMINFTSANLQEAENA
ncbi:MAG: DUF4116 domain-containing protein [Chlamydiae bacterium]|nr:DUF4116 domain-containing protein [Chlamydiota bacterium]